MCQVGRRKQSLLVYAWKSSGVGVEMWPTVHVHILLERALMLKLKVLPDTDDLKPNDLFLGESS